MRALSRFSALLFVVMLIVVPVASASQNALVTGSVYDQSGAPIPRATIRLINASTGFSQTQMTDANGIYTFASVPPAAGYVLSVEVSGFATQIREDQEVNVGDYRLVQPPFIMQPLVAAAPKEAVVPAAPGAPKAPPTTPAPAAAPVPARAAPVPAAPAPTARVTRAIQAPTVALDLANTMVGGVIDSRMVRTLPLANRDFFDLALLVAGTYPTEQGSPLEGASLVVNGVRANMNNFLLDGVDNNDYTINQALPFQIVEAMQEFRVQTSVSPAEYGRSGGSQINTISRSGANPLHGSLFEFNRNSALSSQYALSAYRGGTFDAYAQYGRVNEILKGPNTAWPTPILNDPGLASTFNSGRDPHFNQNQFGGNLGGHIVKDKAFFFLNWESFRAQDPRPVLERVPDNTCRDPNACAVLVNGPGATPEFPVSAGLVGKLLNLYPAPNVPASSVNNAFGFPVSDPQQGDTSVSGAFFAGQSQNFTHSDNFLERADLRPSNRLSMSFKHNIQRISQIQGGSLPQTSNYPGNGIDVDGRNQNFSFNLVGSISDRTVNEFRLGWNRFRLTTLPLDHTLDPSAIFHNLNSTNKGFPILLIGGFDNTRGPYASLGGSFAVPSDRADSVTSASDSLSLTRGRHEFKFGGEFRHNRLNVDNEGAARGLVTLFSTPFGSITGEPDLASIARVAPDFGGVNGIGGFDRSFHSNSVDWFIQDNWRLRSNVTLTLGLRHEINQAPIEARNRLVNDYPYLCTDSTGAASPVCLMRVGDVNQTIYDSDGTIRGKAGFTAPLAGFTTDYNNFGPHVGLAWDPLNKGKTVFRAGYALMYDQMSLQPSVNMLLNPPFVQQAMALSGQFVLGDTFPPYFPLSNNCLALGGMNCWLSDGGGFFNYSGEGLNLGLGSLWFAQPYSITARDPNTRTPYVHQFYGGVEQQLGNKAMFELAYVGSIGQRLLRNRLLQECTAGTFLSNAFACLPRTFSDLGPPYGSASDSVINQETTGQSYFHSLQARFDTRAFHGLSVHAHYLWAHSIDNASSPVTPVFLLSPTAASLMKFTGDINADQFAALNNANPTLSLRPGFPSIITRGLLPNDTENSNNLEGERASSDFDIRHRLVIYYAYDLPKVQGLRAIGNGWEVAGITTFQKGQPFTVFGDFFGVPLRPNAAGTAAINNSNPDGAIDNALPAGCNVSFASPCAGASGATSAFDVGPTFSFQPGSLPRNSFIGPRLLDFDFSILKNTYLGKGERTNLQFRIEFFNLFNTTNYRQPFSQEGQFMNVGISGLGIADPNPFFGQILQAYDPRTIQFALKLVF